MSSLSIGESESVSSVLPNTETSNTSRAPSILSTIHGVDYNMPASIEMSITEAPTMPDVNLVTTPSPNVPYVSRQHTIGIEIEQEQPVPLATAGFSGAVRRILVLVFFAVLTGVIGTGVYRITKSNALVFGVLGVVGPFAVKIAEFVPIRMRRGGMV